MFARAGFICPQNQLGAENNIEKSRCLAQMRKKIRATERRSAGFSGLRAIPRRRAALESAAITVISGM
jgi:hypothetical protein